MNVNWLLLILAFVMALVLLLERIPPSSLRQFGEYCLKRATAKEAFNKVFEKENQ